ncbi:Uncharacterised protein [Vibrio cholerae]|nr:Uncharacterised protein [Vibrio cholerae]CSH90370.1 Uncharacterised protein [Vibrio cholerae]CSI66601.1 Uncharacterised protein [Vibrio cholerae]
MRSKLCCTKRSASKEDASRNRESSSNVSQGVEKVRVSFAFSTLQGIRSVRLL